MSGEAEKAQHVSQPKKEKDKEEVDKYNLKSKISFFSEAKVGRFLESPDTEKEEEILRYVKAYSTKFGKIIEKIKNKGKNFPFVIKKRGDKEIVDVKGLPPQKMPLPWYSTHNYFGNYPIERAVKEKRKDVDPKKVVWDAIRFGISDENRNYGESPNTPMAYRMTYYMNVALAQNEKGKEFLKKLMKGFVETAKSSKGKKKIRSGVFEAEGKKYPAGVIVSMSMSGEHGGAFRTTEEAFKNLIEEVEKINPYWGAISDALFVAKRRAINAPLSEVYKYVANKEIEAMEKKLREFDPNGKSEAWEELKKVSGIKEFFRKVYEIAYGKNLTENEPLMNMLWDSTNLDAFVIYFLAKDVLGEKGNFKYLNTDKDYCAWSMTEHIGSIIHSLEKKYGINISDKFEPVMKWNIIEIYDRDVDKTHVTQKEVRKDKTLEKVEKPAKGISKYIRLGIAGLSAPPITAIIYAIAPKLVDTVGNYLTQLGIGNDPHVVGMGAFTAATGAIVYGLTNILFRSAAEEIEKKEYERRAEKTEIVTKTGEKYSSFNEWVKKRLPKIIEENKTEIYESIRDWMLNYAIPEAKKRVEEVYNQVKEAEEKGYIPPTTKEIWENYDIAKKEVYKLGRDKNGNVIDDFSHAKLSFGTCGDFDRLRMML